MLYKSLLKALMLLCLLECNRVLFFRYSNFQFFDELAHGKNCGVKLTELADKPLNKKIKFSDSESSSSDDDDNEEEEEEKGDDDENKKVPEEGSKSPKEQNEPSNENETTDVVNPNQEETVAPENQTEEKSNDNERDMKCPEVPSEEVEEPPNKKHCVEADASKSNIKEKEKSIDQLIEAELQELGDKTKVGYKISIIRLFLFLIFNNFLLL